MGRELKTLFCFHSAGRNGASIMLLGFLEWLKANRKFGCEALVHGKGPLTAKISECCKTKTWSNPAAIARALPRRFSSPVERVISRLALQWVLGPSQYDLIYVNTAALGSWLPVLRRRARRVVWHIHELKYGLSLTLGARVRELAEGVDRVVAASDSVRASLLGDFNLEPAKVTTVHEFIPTTHSVATETSAIRMRIRESLQIPPNAFVMGGCGTPGWRKGTDAFLQIASRMLGKLGADAFRAIWVGGSQNGEDALKLDYDIRGLGLEAVCLRVPTTGEVADYFKAMDVFALTSREDPFPLVMLEAAAERLPILCFSGSGGGPEFVGGDAGFIIPYLDLDGFAEKLGALCFNTQLRSSLGQAGCNRLRERFTVERQAPMLSRLIETELARAV